MPTKLVLPFTLKVAGKDEFVGLNAVSTSFQFHGLLHFDGALIQIEWAGSARVQNVGALDVSDERLPLPAESLDFPVERLRTAELAGSWWRPRLEISARDLQTLSTVPSEERGMVRLWYARHDRAGAIAIAAALSRAIAPPTFPSDAPAGPLRSGESRV